LAAARDGSFDEPKLGRISILDAKHAILRGRNFGRFAAAMLRRNGGESCCGATDKPCCGATVMMRCSNDDAPMQNAALWPKCLTPPGGI
jgi:hypothetical protein